MNFRPLLTHWLPLTIGIGLVAVWAYLFAYPRITYADSAYQFFLMVNEERFVIETFRIANYVLQVPTRVAIALGLPLKVLIPLFSLSFVGVWALSLVGVRWVLRQPQFALPLLACLLFPLQKLFFNPVSETPQALAYFGLVWVWVVTPPQLTRLPNQWLYLALGSLAFFLAFFSHPVVFVLLGFCIALHTGVEGKLPPWWVWGLGIFAVGVYVLKGAWVPAQNYETHYVEQLLNFRASLARFREWYSLHFVAKHFWSLYWPAFAIWCSLVGLWVWRRAYRAAAVYSLLSLLLALITLIAYQQGDSDPMMERAIMPLAFWAGFSFFLYAPRLVRTQWGHLALFVAAALLVGSGLVHTHAAGKGYRQRVDLLRGYVAQAQAAGLRKARVAPTEDDKLVIEVPWAFSLETLLISSASGQSVSVAYTPDTSVSIDSLPPNVLHQPDWAGPLWHHSLNPSYFSVPEAAYTLLPPVHNAQTPH